MAIASDSVSRDLACGLLNRKLYKCLDIGERTKREGSDSVPHFRRRLSERQENGEGVLTDEAWLTAYGIHEFEDPGAFQKVLIGRPDSSGKSDDINERSPIVGSIKRQRIFRVYCADTKTFDSIEKMLEEVVR